MPAEKQSILDLYAEGLSLYKNRKWHEAIEVFGRIFELDSEDGPSLT